MTTEHEEKVRECLALLQEAQTLVNAAASALCSVPGFANEWSGLSKPYETIKSHWHKVAARREKLRRPKHGSLT